MTTLEFQVEQELHYDKIAATRPDWAEVNKTYIRWVIAGRQVMKGEASKSYYVQVCVGTRENPLTGEDEPRYSARTVRTFHVDQTSPR